MPMIDVDPDVHAYILALTRTTGESESAILRRTFEIPGPNGKPAAAHRSFVPKDGRHRDLLNFLDSPQFRAGKVVTKKYLALLAFLYRQDGALFEQVFEVSGRHRKYFGRSKDEIVKSGKSLHPRQIPGSPLWVMTNADTEQKQEIALRVLTVLGYERAVATRAAQVIA